MWRPWAYQVVWMRCCCNVKFVGHLRQALICRLRAPHQYRLRTKDSSGRGRARNRYVPQVLPLGTGPLREPFGRRGAFGGWRVAIFGRPKCIQIDEGGERAKAIWTDFCANLTGRAHTHGSSNAAMDSPGEFITARSDGRVRGSRPNKFRRGLSIVFMLPLA